MLYWNKDINGNWPYWEAIANLEPDPETGGMRLKPDVYEGRTKGAMPGDEKPDVPPDAPPPPWQTVK